VTLEELIKIQSTKMVQFCEGKMNEMNGLMKEEEEML